MTKLLSLLLCAVALLSSAHCEEKSAFPVSTLSGIAANMDWIGPAVDDPDYYVWCTSPILGPDGKVHLFCSRWPKEYKFEGWSTHGEIAHYVGDSPEGPFRFSDVSLTANPSTDSVHNPAIARAGDKYVLLYIIFDKSSGGKMLTSMAISDSLSGPWKKVNGGRPILQPSDDPHHWTHNPWAMDNPTFLAHDGKFYVFFKAAPAGHQLESRYGFAVSDKLEGPYKVSDAPCTDNISYIEDATAFVWDKKICLLTTDNFGTHTGIEGAGILWKSDTPTQFKMADAQVGFLRPSQYWSLRVPYDMSRVTKLYTSNNVIKFERPGILMIDGRPAYFYAACGTNFQGGDHTCSYVLRINLPPGLTHGKTIESSSIWPEKGPLSNLVDGKPETFWAAKEGDTSAWVTIDLGKEHEISSAMLSDYPFARTQEFTLEAQLGGKWTQIHEGTTIGKNLAISFQPTKARLFRLNILKATDTVTLSELQLYE